MLSDQCADRPATARAKDIRAASRIIDRCSRREVDTAALLRHVVSRFARVHGAPVTYPARATPMRSSVCRVG